MRASCVDTAVVSRNDSCVRRDEDLLAPGRDGLSTNPSAHLTHPAMHLSTLSSISHFLLLAVFHLPSEEETASTAIRLFTLGLRHTARDDPHSTANEIVRAMCHSST